MNKRWIWLAVAALSVVALLAAAYGGDDDDSSPGDDSTGAAVNEISMTMSDELAFDPDRIQARVGQPVRLTINNSGTALHDFTVEDMAVEDVTSDGSGATATGGHGMDMSSEYALHVVVEGGGSGTLEFMPMEAGEYEFMCTATGHADGGMTGTLVVTE